MKRTIPALLALLITLSGCLATIDFAPVSPLPTPAPVNMPTHIDSHHLDSYRAVRVTCASGYPAIIEHYADSIMVGCAGAMIAPVATVPITPTATLSSTVTPTMASSATVTPTPTLTATLTPTATSQQPTPTPTRTVTLITVTPRPTFTSTPTRTPVP